MKINKFDNHQFKLLIWWNYKLMKRLFRVTIIPLLRDFDALKTTSLACDLASRAFDFELLFLLFFLFFSRFFLKTFKLQHDKRFNIFLDNVQSPSRSCLCDNATLKEKHWWKYWISRRNCQLIVMTMFHDCFFRVSTFQNAQIQFDYSNSKVRLHFSSLFLHSQWSHSRCFCHRKYEHKTTREKRVE